jgi:ketosteroid isomerase-like protein
VLGRRPWFLLAGMVACASRGANGGSSEADAHRVHQNYVDAINSNSPDSLLGMMTEDVVFLSANEPVMVGKAAVRPWVDSYYGAYRTHWDKPVQEFVVNGDWAYERYSYASTDTSRTDGSVVRGTGWGLVLYRRDADGKWRVARDAFGPDHPPAK